MIHHVKTTKILNAAIGLMGAITMMEWIDIGIRILSFIFMIIAFGFAVRIHRKKSKILDTQQQQEDHKLFLLMDEIKKRSNGHDKA